MQNWFSLYTPGEACSSRPKDSIVIVPIINTPRREPPSSCWTAPPVMQVQRIMRDKQGSVLLVRHLAANPQDKDSLKCMAVGGTLNPKHWNPWRKGSDKNIP